MSARFLVHYCNVSTPCVEASPFDIASESVSVPQKVDFTSAAGSEAERTPEVGEGTGGEAREVAQRGQPKSKEGGGEEIELHRGVLLHSALPFMIGHAPSWISGDLCMFCCFGRRDGERSRSLDVFLLSGMTCCRKC